MKKRLIILLLVICLVAGTFFGTIPKVRACGLPDYDNQDDRVEAVFCHARLDADLYVRKNPYEARDEDPYLKKGVEVWVICMVVDQGKFFYQVSVEKMGVKGYVPCDEATLLHDHEEHVPNEEEHDCAADNDSPQAEKESEKENIEWENVAQYGTINKNNVTVRRDIATQKPEDPQLDEDCNVWVKARGYWKGEYWYHISMGYYGEMYVRTKFVTLESEKKQAEADAYKASTLETEPKKERSAKQEEHELSTVTEKVDAVAEEGKTSTLDRYIFFTNQGSAQYMAWYLNQRRFQELYMF